MVFDFTGFYYDFFLSRIVSAAVIFFLGFILGKVFGKLAKRVLRELDFNRITSRVVRLNSEKILSNMISYAVYLATIIMVLNRLEITGYILRGILLFLMVIIFLELLLHLKDFLPNIIAWAMLKRRVSSQDIIKTGLAQGKVEKITLLSIRITTRDGDELYIPNRSLLSGMSVKKKNSPT